VVGDLGLIFGQTLNIKIPVSCETAAPSLASRGDKKVRGTATTSIQESTRKEQGLFQWLSANIGLI
jgi:hypothetical protein